MKSKASRLVLVDASAGTLFGPTLGRLVTQIRVAGYQPAQVDDVLITLMHCDHVGGLVADGQRRFPDATVHADKADADFWLSQARADAAPAAMKGFFQGASASLTPYVKADAFSRSSMTARSCRAYARSRHTVTPPAIRPTRWRARASGSC